MSAREQMLTRIRGALGHAPAGSAPSILPSPELGPVMPPVGADLAAKFEAELNQVGGGTYRVATVAELDQVLAKILDDSESYTSNDETPGQGVVLSRNPLLQQLGLAERLSGSSKAVTIWPWGGSRPQQSSSRPENPSREDEPTRQAFKEQCFGALAGISGVDFALAESGTLVLSSLTEGSQLTSLAPPVHIALYRRQQLVASLEEVLEKASIAGDRGFLGGGRSIVLITGTSRTADIEQILIRGVNGPRQVHAILVEDSCFIGSTLSQHV